METENTLVVSMAGGLGGRGEGAGVTASFNHQINCGDTSTALWLHEKPLNCTFHMGELYIHLNIWINISAFKKKKDSRKEKSLCNSIKNLTSKSLKHWPWLFPQ